jgi:ribosomal protein S18 acetylase RimI-like enzyme
MASAGPAVNVEDAKPGDLAEILALQRLAYRSEAALYDAYDDMPPLTQTADEIREEFARSTFLKVVVDGRIVGAVRAHVAEGTCHIGRLIVHPDFQRRGIGSAMMAEVERRFAHAARFELFTGNRSERNIRLYRKLGYEIFKTVPVRDAVAHVYLEKVSK